VVKASYTNAGIKGLLKDGGSARRAAVQKVVESAGGTLEAFYFAYGTDDAIIIADFKEPADALAVSLTVNAAGGAQISLTPLIAPEDIDAACRKSVSYRAPGA
jgi:uncharacterized protein with GYD domain